MVDISGKRQREIFSPFCIKHSRANKILETLLKCGSILGFRDAVLHSLLADEVGRFRRLITRFNNETRQAVVSLADGAPGMRPS